jgi:uncharacterized protein YbbK (DUF523 family)
MEKVLVSACLLGQRVRYDGRDARVESGILDRWEAEGRIVPICPEVAGGLPTPRPPAEIQGGDGAAILSGKARVATRTADVTDAFLAGAEAALRLAHGHGISVAVLKDRSPSCASRLVYDGSFTGRAVRGLGVTAARLAAEGIRVFSEEELEAADALLRRL